MWTAEDREGLYRDGLRIRALSASAFLAFFGAVGLIGWAPRIEGYWAVIGTLVVLIVINPVLWAIGASRCFPLRDFFFHWIADIGAVSLIVYNLGIFDIPLASVAYMIMIVSSAAFVTMTAAMILAVISTIAWSALWLGSMTGWLEHRHVDFGVHWSAEGEAFLSGASIVFFFLFAYVSGSIAEKLRGKSLRLIDKQTQLEAAVELERTSRNRIELLSAIVQHDVYGPLAVVEGASAEALRCLEETDAVAAGRYLRMIGRRLPGISSAIESLGLFRDGATTEFNEGVGVKELVETVLEDLRAEIEERRVAVDIVGSGVVVEVERRKLYHVMRNLVSNAVKCVPDDGSGLVTVELHIDASGMARIAVSDNGPGLSDALVKSLTGQPTRPATPERTGTGLGVGLSLAQSLAQAWGGRIEYAEGPGGGARVSVIAPSWKGASTTKSSPVADVDAV